MSCRIYWIFCVFSLNLEATHILQTMIKVLNLHLHLHLHHRVLLSLAIHMTQIISELIQSCLHLDLARFFKILTLPNSCSICCHQIIMISISIILRYIFRRDLVLKRQIIHRDFLLVTQMLNWRLKSASKYGV